MLQFQIPKNSYNIYRYLDCAVQESKPEPIISTSLSGYLGDIKQRIDSLEKEWDVFKRYTNPYEYIHTTVPGKRKCISKYKPLSRAYFKMIELVQFYRLLDRYTTPIQSFHLAEGPGGFIEALAMFRRNYSKCKDQDQYIGMTIMDDAEDPNIPAWKKSRHFLSENPTVHIEVGQDKTGDILSVENFRYCSQKYRASMDVITGDGGFDFSTDFNNQEAQIAKLLFGQIAYALCMQRSGGCFILKIFDCFMQHTLDLLSLLSSMYEKVYITKPQTSRFANSEKYVVCKGFRGNVANFFPYLEKTFIKMVESTDEYIVRFLQCPSSILFVSRIEEYNAIFGRQQIDNIYYTLSLMENRGDKLDNLIKQNVIRCIGWCVKHNVIYNVWD